MLLLAIALEGAASTQEWTLAVGPESRLPPRPQPPKAARVGPALELWDMAESSARQSAEEVGHTGVCEWTSLAPLAAACRPPTLPRRMHGHIIRRNGDVSRPTYRKKVQKLTFGLTVCGSCWRCAATTAAAR